MKKYSFLYIIIAFFILVGCKKEGSSNYTISGYIYKDCSMQPASLEEVELYQTNAGEFPVPDGGRLGVTTTDANGYFSFNYIPKSSASLQLNVTSGFGSKTLVTMPCKQNLSELRIFKAWIGNFQFVLNPTRQGSLGDSLVVSMGLEIKKVPCPIEPDTVIDFPNIPLEDVFYRNGHIESQEEVTWNFQSTPTDYYVKSVIINRFCSDTVKTVIDVN